MSFAATALRLSAGVLVWALHFAAIYGFTALACARQLPAPVPWAVALATLAAAAGCLLILRQELARPGFEAWLAAGLAALALLAIVWEALPVLMVPPCA